MKKDKIISLISKLAGCFFLFIYFLFNEKWLTKALFLQNSMLRTFIDKYMYIVTVVIVQQARFPSQTYLKPNSRWQGSTLCGLKKKKEKKLSDRTIGSKNIECFTIELFS